MTPNAKFVRGIEKERSMLNTFFHAIAAIALLAGQTTGDMQALSKTSKGDAGPVLEVRAIESGLDLPVFVTAAPGDSSRLFALEKLGTIRIIANGQLLETPFLDITPLLSLGNERGLLGLAFHPAYDSNGQFYVFYTNDDGDLVVAEYKVSANANIADPDSGRILITVTHSTPCSFPPRPSNHNGGMIAFGPNDGYLYIGTGDGGDRDDPCDQAENKAILLGKILRIDVDTTEGDLQYGIPDTNPFVNEQDARGEIWAFGLRNPWRFSFDRETGDLWIGDVGQNDREEVDFQPAASLGGEDYGWNEAEGFACLGGTGTCGTNPGYTPPIIDYPHSNDTGGFSITGGYAYRGKRIPGLEGTYFYADYVLGKIWSLRYNGTMVSEAQERTATFDPQDTIGNVSAFGEDAQGELYFCDYTNGVIYKIFTRYGNINGDAEIDAVDVQLVVNGALGIDISPFSADISGDAEVNAEDVQLGINAALGLF